MDCKDYYKKIHICQDGVNEFGWPLCLVPLQSFRDNLCETCVGDQTFTQWKRHWKQTFKMLVEGFKPGPCEYNDSPTFWHALLYSLVGVEDNNDANEIRRIFFLANEYVPLSKLSNQGNMIHLPIHELIIQSCFPPFYLSLIYQFGYGERNVEKFELKQVSMPISKIYQKGMLFAIYDPAGTGGPRDRLVRIVDNDIHGFQLHWLGWERSYDFISTVINGRIFGGNTVAVTRQHRLSVVAMLPATLLPFSDGEEYSFLKLFVPRTTNNKRSRIGDYTLSETIGKTLYKQRHNLFCKNIANIILQFPIVLISILFQYCSSDCFVFDINCLNKLSDWELLFYG